MRIGHRGAVSGRTEGARQRTSGRATFDVLLLLTCVWVAMPGWAQSPPDWHDKLAPGLRDRVARAVASEAIPIGVVLRESGLPGHARAAARRSAIGDRRGRLLDRLPPGLVEMRRSYENLAGFAARVGPAGLEVLARDPEVEHVYVDGRLYATLNQGRVLIGADQAHVNGYTGNGIVVAVLDSGIDTDHPDLVDDLVAERCYCRGGVGPFGCCPNGFDTQTGAGAAEDDDGHGTSVTGIITSSGAVSAVGVAPDAGIVAVKVLDEDGSGSFSDAAAALDWLLSSHVALGVEVVNMSLGDPNEYDDPTVSPCQGSNTANAIAALTAAGVTVFVSSGNDAFTDGISFPACVADAISVGGVYDQPFSSVGWCGETCGTILCTDTNISTGDFVCHTNSDEILDLLAPDYRTRTSQLGGGVETMFGGTSAASPYAAAMAALLIERDPTLTPAEIRTVMTTHGTLVENPANGLFHPRTDIATFFAVCGNGSVELGEDCDDGNTENGDCCTSTCGFEALASTCDDGDDCTEGDTCDGLGVCVPGPPPPFPACPVSVPSGGPPFAVLLALVLTLAGGSALARHGVAA